MPVSIRRQVSELAENIRRIRDDGLRDPRVVHSIEAYRQELAAARLAIPDNGYWLNVCTAQTGAGKSTADIAPIRRLIGEGKTSVILAPDHQNCREIVAKLRAAGIPAAAYPRLDEETCARYEEAKAIVGLGLSAVGALCHDCPYQAGCPHHEQYEEAQQATVKVATQTRGRLALPVLTEGCSYLSIQEETINFFAPVFSLGDGGWDAGQRPNIERVHPLLVVGRIADQGAASATDPNDRAFYRHLASVARYLDREHHAAYETAEVELPKAAHHEPRTLHRDLHDAALDLRLAYRPPAEAMQLTLAAATGQLRRLCVIMNETRGELGAVRLWCALTGVGKTDIPPGVPAILSDASADLDVIRAVQERPVREVTPVGALPLVHPVLQVCPSYDVTRARKVNHAADILRGIMHDLPQYHRVGLLTQHTLHGKVVAALGERYASRITLEAYFGDGLSRGSNEWLAQCDVIIILGTPRPGTPSIRQHLSQVNKVRAAALTEEQAGWHLARWMGTTESGEAVEIETPRYRDEDWHRAYCNIAKSQLKQAIGRGRGILPDGIPVYVVTTEDIGDRMTQQTGRIPIADAPFAPLRLEEAEILRVLVGTSGSRPLKPREIALRLGMANPREDIGETNRRRIKYRLKNLYEAGRINCKGKKGWYIPGGGIA